MPPKGYKSYDNGKTYVAPPIGGALRKPLKSKGGRKAGNATDLLKARAKVRKAAQTLDLNLDGFKASKTIKAFATPGREVPYEEFVTGNHRPGDYAVLNPEDRGYKSPAEIKLEQAIDAINEAFHLAVRLARKDAYDDLLGKIAKLVERQDE